MLSFAFLLSFSQFGSKFFAENVFFQNPLIASGPCPNCEADNVVLFGNVLGVEGFSDSAKLKCSNCKTELNVARSNLRVSSEPKPEVTAPAPAAAAAAAEA